MVDDTGQKLVPAVQNAMIIMRLLAASGRPMGATQIAREAGLNVSSAFNILRTLSHEGLLRAVGLPRESFCMGCFTGNHPIPVQLEMNKLALEVSSP